VSVRSGGGGGYGDPALRDASSIERDRRAGFAT
jgi:N-methylhydantoinase B/oxoprolinase/acetone carboxylase alpha subunit